jgi:hypothetical protein
VESADRATLIAVTFLAQYYSWLQPLKARQEDGQWLVEVDTGAFAAKIARVAVDTRTGKIVQFERPPSIP